MDDGKLAHPVIRHVCLLGRRFDNPWPTWRFPSFVWAVILFVKSLITGPRVPSQEELDQQLPVRRPRFDAGGRDALAATWLGHASVLLRVDGWLVLCDPVFSERCSPVQFLGPRRYRPPPCTVAQLPELDAVVISHTHYDHLDYASVVALQRRFPEVQWFVPLGCGDWMRGCGCKQVTEMTWWEETKLKGSAGDLRVVFTPTQHWSGRGVFDRNKCLWGSWALLGPRHRVWFGGDTGYCEAFKQIGEKLGPFDLAAIPIGAYEPRWFLSPQHVDPDHAVKIHLDIKSRLSVGVHWGTFIMTCSCENVLQPRADLRKAVKDADLLEDSFVTVEHGETLMALRNGRHDVEYDNRKI